VLARQSGVLVIRMVVARNGLERRSVRVCQGAAGRAEDISHAQVSKGFRRHDQEFIRIE
jgi:hypothetical protein